MNNLDQYFAKARLRQQVIPFEQITALLDVEVAPVAEVIDEHRTSSINSKKIMITVVFSALALAAGIGIVNSVRTTETIAGESRQAAALPHTSQVRTIVPDVGSVSGELQNRSTTIPSVAAPLQRRERKSIHATNPLLVGEDREPTPHQKREDEKPPVDISGVKVIELSAEELARLGTRGDTAGVWVSAMEGGERQNFRISITGFSMESQAPELQGLTPLPLFPTLITDDRGMWRMMSYDAEVVDSALDARIKSLPAESVERADLVMEMSTKANLYVKNTMNSLIPILVRTGRAYTAADSLARRWRPDCILWIRPTPEVVSRLPEPIRTRIATELAAVPSLAHTESAPLRTLPGEQPYLDILRTASGAVQGSTLHPNPTRDRVTLDCSLAQPRTVSITLHTIDGDLLRRLVDGRTLAAGDGTVNLDVGELNPGVYLVALSTDKGERVVQRLIVQK